MDRLGAHSSLPILMDTELPRTKIPGTDFLWVEELNKLVGAFIYDALVSSPVRLPFLMNVGEVAIRAS